MFRTFIKSRIGLVVVFLVLGFITLAFALTSGTGIEKMVASKDNVIAKVGNREITDVDLTTEIQNFIRQQQARNQNITMDQFLASPYFDQTIDRMIAYAAVEEFAKNSGMKADSTLIDSDIANDPSLQGFDGKFSQSKFEELIAENRVSAATYRSRLATNHYLTWILDSVAPISQLPTDVIAPYASLQLERRAGTVALIRWNDVPEAADPDAKTLEAYYQRNRAHYMIPPRRVLRYAAVHPDQFKAAQAATEAEIAEAYAKSGVRFAASEKRTVHQLVLLDQASATSAAAELKGGKSIAEVATARGLEPRAFDSLEKPALAKETSSAVADAAFSVPQGGTVGPVKGTFGWVVMHIDTVTPIAAKSLAEAHGTLADEITQRKVAKTIGTLRQALDDAAGNGANFNALMQQGKLTPQVTAALAPNGTDPTVPDAKVDPVLAPVIEIGFKADPTDPEPSVGLIGDDGSFAVVTIDKSIPAQLKPLAQIHDQVLRDYLLELRLQNARKVANDVINAVNKGTPLQQALAATGLHTLLPTQNFGMTRQEVIRSARTQQGPPPQYVLAFQTGAKHAKLVEAPAKVGYYIVYVDAIEPHDARGTPMMEAAQKALGPQLQEETLEQFVDGIKKNVKITRYPAVIAAVRASLSTQGAR
jgi:peptidyl-prolyl cis-trans isomerase D